jgi:hypothetical protein
MIGTLEREQTSTRPMLFVRIGHHAVNINNIVSLEIEGPNIVEIWYVGSPTPVALKPPVPAAPILDLMQANSWLV